MEWITKAPRRLQACRRNGSPRNLRRTPAENWTTVRGRFPGSRVRAPCPPSRSVKDQWQLDEGSPVTVAGAAAVSHRVPYTLHLAAALAPDRAQKQPWASSKATIPRPGAGLLAATRVRAFALGSAKFPTIETKKRGCPMPLQINDIAPNFTAETTEGKIDFYQWAGNHWVVLFSHPKDFTPVCTTELGRVAKLKPEFDKRGVKVIGLSVDPVENHGKWAADIAETQGMGPNYPMIGDTDLKVSKLYGMLPADTSGTSEGRTPANNATVRNVFIISPDKKIQLLIVYP